MESPHSGLQEKNTNSNIFSSVEDKKLDQQMNEQIELMIQSQFQIFIPALIFEYKSPQVILSQQSSSIRDFHGWDYDDLYDFFSHFGEIDIVEISGKSAIILFKLFSDAYSAREFLSQPSNLKDSQKTIIRWYSSDEEHIISDIMRLRMRKYTPSQITENINYSKNSENNNNFIQNNFQQSYNHPNDYVGANFNSQYSYYSSWCLSPQARNEFNTILYKQPGELKSAFQYINEEEGGKSFGSGNDKFLANGKYICKYEIQIDKDNEFQVARRIIGAKGCNMKRIVELCSTNYDGKLVQDSIKIRLRGRGSGYKEGPFNRESDEPLHLCITSKYFDKYKKACTLVQELIINLYEEFKRFCERSGKIPNSNLAIQKEEGVSTRKANPISNVHNSRESNIIVDN